MNQLDAFNLILDQLARDFVIDSVPLAKRGDLMKAYGVLEKTRNKRAHAKKKRAFSEHLMGGK